MSEEAKAVQEVAKAASNAVDAGRELGGFIGRSVRGSVEAAMGILQDKLVYIRWERQQRLFQRAEEFRAQAGLTGTPGPIPLNVAVPLIMGAVLEEDDSLQDEWAKLLVNAAIPSERSGKFKMFVNILEGMTAEDAKILRSIAEAPEEYTDGHGVVATQNLPHAYRKIAARSPEEDTSPPDDTKVVLFNLQRLGLIDQGGWGGSTFHLAFITPLGTAFVKACTIQPPPTD